MMISAAAAAALGTRTRAAVGTGAKVGIGEVSRCKLVTKVSYHRYLSSQAKKASLLYALQCQQDGLLSLRLFEPLSHGVISRNHGLGPR